jgi:hypothetical protein
MVAVSRFVEFSATGSTFASGVTSGAETAARGSRGYSRGTGLSAGEDSFTITLNSNDQLAVNINGLGAQTITLASGTDLDPRFVARDIAFKLHSASSDDAYNFAQCTWGNGYGPISNAGPISALSAFTIWSGKLGNNGGANDVNVTAGGNDARTTLGFDSVSEAAGVDFATDFAASSYTGVVAISGAYSGQFDDLYTVQITDGELINAPTPNGGNTYGGTATTDGMYIGAADNTYTLTIDTTNGSSMGAGSSNVPTFVVTDSPGSDGDGTTAVELLYSDHYYDIGSLGARVKFSDAVFGNGDVFTVDTFTASGTGYPKAPGSAKYIWSSTLGDSSKSIGIAAQTTQNTPTQLGTKGVEISWSGATSLSLGERFNAMSRGPQPTDSDVTQLNFGNVTVSTNSAVKVVWFELISGAVSMSTVKFSLQADGTFQHHDQGDSDTEFHYGTSGGGNSAPGAGPTTGSQAEFSVDSAGVGNIDATDIDSDTPPSNLFATKADLAVVNSADNAESLGNFQGAVVSDFVYLAIKLGANETGANSTINYRMFFDFS